MNEKFEKILEEVSNSPILSEVEEYGYRHFDESYINDIGDEIKIIINELNGKIYLLRYVNEKCVMFKEL